MSQSLGRLGRLKCLFRVCKTSQTLKRRLKRPKLWDVWNVFSYRRDLWKLNAKTLRTLGHDDLWPETIGSIGFVDCCEKSAETYSKNVNRKLTTIDETKWSYHLCSWSFGEYCHATSTNSILQEGGGDLWSIDLRSFVMLLTVSNSWSDWIQAQIFLPCNGRLHHICQSLQPKCFFLGIITSAVHSLSF